MKNTIRNIRRCDGFIFAAPLYRKQRRRSYCWYFRVVVLAHFLCVILCDAIHVINYILISSVQIVNIICNLFNTQLSRQIYASE